MKPLLPPVRVNGQDISPERIAAEAQMHPAPKGKPGLAWRAAARALALREVLLQEARRRGLEADPAEISPGRFETADEALIRALLDQALSPAPASDEELRAVWSRDPSRFRAPTLWEVSHILFAAPADGDRSAARAEAEATIAALAGDPGAFARLARERSACSSAASGGKIGQVGPGDTVPEFEAALAALSPGETSSVPVETGFGLHVLRLDARAEGAVLPFESVLPRLREAAEKAAWVRAARAFGQELMAKAEVEGLETEAA